MWGWAARGVAPGSTDPSRTPNQILTTPHAHEVMTMNGDVARSGHLVLGMLIVVLVCVVFMSLPSAPP